MLLAGPKSEEAEEARIPMVVDRAVVSIRAARLGRNRSSSIAASTRVRVSSRMLGCPFITRDTVWRETPAIRATSRTPGALLDPFASTGTA
jgi:hypothetical protein